MILNRQLAATLFALPLVASSLWSLPGAPAAGQELGSLLKERAQAAKEMSTAEIWAQAAAIENLLSAGDEDNSNDELLDNLIRSTEESNERGLLLLIAVRLSTYSPDYTLLTEKLKPLFESTDQSIRETAGGLFRDAEFNQIDIEQLRDVIKALLAGAENIDNLPNTRLAFAAAAFAQGGGSVRTDARKVMLSFLKSSDPQLRATGALALAEIGDLETAREELERIHLQPDAQGRLAAAFLKTEDLKGYYESRLRAQRTALAEATDTESRPTEGLESIEQMMGLILNRHIEGDTLDRQELLDAALGGMLRSLDQHSSYMNTESFSRFQQDISGEYGGIGAYVNVDRTDNLFTITQPIYSGPAYKADLRSDDKIIMIDEWPTHDHGISKDQDDIIRRLKGKPDTPVKLYIWRRGMEPGLIERPTEDMAVTVMRGFITIPTVKSDMLPGDIGLIQLDQFSGVASQEVEKALLDLLERGADSLVLDLRNNPGGLLHEARAVSDLFLPKGKRVVSTVSRMDEPEVLKTKRDYVWPADKPVVVLINRFSASASEIVSGALQDHGQATLVGQRSFGKGSVQNLIRMGLDDRFKDENKNNVHDNWEPLTRDFNGNGEFDYAARAKLTVARYLLPSGRSIHRELDEEGNITSLGGVTPEILVDPKRYETWRLEAMYDLQDKRLVRTWVADNWEAHKELFVQLAYTDNKNPDAYPGFDSFYSGLDTPLSREDVRFMLRSELRRLAQDERGSAFPRGDFVEDVQLQKGIEVVLEQTKRKIDDIPEYKATFQQGEDLAGPALARADELRGQNLGVREALGLIDQARKDNGQLSEEKLKQLQEILNKLDH